MAKLTGSVGKMGPNKTGDVALVQAALMHAKGGPFWPGPIDGKKTPKLIEAITAFQSANRVTPANGTIQSFGPTMNRLKGALPMSMSGLGALPDTAVVFVASAGTREAEKEAADTKAKAPFPKLEAEALAKIQKTIGKSAGLCLVRSQDSVTRDGCFATELDFQGVKWLDPRSAKPMAPGREPAGVTNYVWSQIGTGTPWQKGSPQDLVFKSKRQFKSLQNLGTGPLSADDKKFLNITTPPTGPVLLACAKGCAALIRSGRAAKPEGRKEADVLIEAVSNVDPKLGKKLTAAINAAGGRQIASPEPLGENTVFAGDDINAIDAAAIDGLLLCAKLTREACDKRERGGDIVRVEGGFTYNSIEVGTARGERVGVAVSKNAVAWFHTHPPIGDDTRKKQDEEISGLKPLAGTRFRQFPSDFYAILKIKKLTGSLPMTYLGTPSGKIRRWTGTSRSFVTLKPEGYLRYT